MGWKIWVGIAVFFSFFFKFSFFWHFGIFLTFLLMFWWDFLHFRYPYFDQLDQFRPILVNVGPFGQFWAILGHFGPYDPHVTPYLMEWCWNEVGTELRTSKLTSFGHLPDPECSKCGPRGPKSGQNKPKIAFWQHKSAQRACFVLQGCDKVGTQQGASGQTRWSICQTQIVPNVAPGGPRSGQNRPN